MSSLTKSDVLALYKNLIRTATKFPQYSYRHFAQRRIRDYFLANKTTSDREKLSLLHKDAQQALRSLERQVRVSSDYPYRPLVIESIPHH